MAHRTILTERQRSALFDLPTDDAAMLRHYTLADEDLEIIHVRRGPHNRFGFALQLCALRYPGRLLAPGENIPLEVTRFLAAQLGLQPDDLIDYGAREETRRDHLITLREVYGYRMFSGRGARDLKDWLERKAETARSNEDLARRLAILAVCAVEWHAGIADAVVETHDRIVGKTWQDAKRLCDARIADAKSTLYDTLSSFKNLGAALLEAKGDEASLDAATETSCGWLQLEGLVAAAAELTDTMSADPIAHVVQGYHRFRRYAPRMLRALDIHGATVALPLMQVAQVVADDRNGKSQSTSFLRRGSKWHRHLNAQAVDDHRLWEVAVLSHLREAFRSGDIWLAHSRRYADLKQALVPVEAAQATPRLTVPFDPESWLEDRKARLTDGLDRLAKAARSGTIPGGSIENGILKIDRLTSAVPEAAEALVLDLYDRLPAVRITDLLLEVDDATGFTVCAVSVPLI